MSARRSHALLLRRCRVCRESAGLIEASCLFFVVVSIFTIGGSIGMLATAPTRAG